MATRIDDCSEGQAVWLAPNAVRRRPVAGAEHAPLSWTELMAEGRRTPPFGVWSWLVAPEPDLPVPASGGLPDGVLRDDLPTPRPHRLFQADATVFRHTLARLPSARSPWLREILDNLTQHTHAGLFGC